MAQIYGSMSWWTSFSLSTGTVMQCDKCTTAFDCVYCSHVTEVAMESSEEELTCALGTEKGKQVQMLMHHSRNTAQKQWEETIMLVLTGAPTALTCVLLV